MKILLLQPPVQDFYDTDIRLQPLGLCYLKGAIKKFFKEDVQVIVRDYHKGKGRQAIPIPPELEYLSPYYPYPDKSPFSTFHRYYHFGAPFEKIAKDVAIEKPGLVGISALFSPYYREVFRCAEAIKRLINVPILAGGPHVSSLPAHILGHPDIDYVIRGEGEMAMIEFIRALRKGKEFEKVPNLGYKQDCQLIFNPIHENFPLEEIPFPDFSDLLLENYRFSKRPLCLMMTSRGCPLHCSFCSVHDTFGPYYRRRDPDDILKEIDLRYLEGYRAFDFEDDNLTFCRDEIKYICERLARSPYAKEITLLAMNGISYMSLDRGLLLAMKKAGFSHLNISLVSSNPDMLKSANRPHSIDKYHEIVQDAASIGFRIVSYQILGLPGETLESMIQTMATMSGLPVLIGASIFYPAPGSPIAKEFNPMSDEDILRSRLTAMSIETENFKRDDIYTLFITARIINFLKGIRFGENTVSISGALEAAKANGGRPALGAELLMKLLKTGILYACTGKGFHPLPRFRSGLFFRIWSQMDRIITLDGGSIVI
ncbi:B12-binding domain-containing radical SAM protein [bacterium]|nr:B12-binding domain-containing radical SAM protein [bacterium]